ncbi:MAG: hypothetical protein SFX73_38820 [Kofleriaceae bacterium]|nr:hypothetical protein [Kofleriaceae bacterium]
MRSHLRTWLVCVLAACQHDAGPRAPAEPIEQMPLPPASGTVIGILIDAAHDLALLDDQVMRLREIDARLDVELRRLEAERPRHRPPVPPGGPPGGGMGGPRAGGPDKAAMARVLAMQTESLRVALRDALAVFSETQRPRAVELLSQHDIDVEAVLATPPPSEALPPRN